eukprot:CAMPEP_0182458764 /NCGR_PEP_ID=MMETSP1319-20130603/4029_1 /TAXON_ID=172717 /ORGANISM="Bolidomonas pacifica, Strain RCC208" /LENGTH=648 /DNA_ID=CAMNT_0024657511 /DNA_START=124 /DNA_END=2067 /DNA_ORIENTATION=-
MTKSTKRQGFSPSISDHASDPLLDPPLAPRYSSIPSASHDTRSSSAGAKGFADPKKRRPSGSQRKHRHTPHPHHSSARILDRTGYFSQSQGRWTIHRKGGAWLYAPFYWDDWFHSLLNAPTRRIFVLLFIAYLLAVVAFAFAYLSISTSGQDGDDVVGGGCGMDITNIMEAYYFSLSTMTTLGYGVSDYYFGDCWGPLVFITLQVFISITFDALAIGVIFQRLSRVQKRARTIVFSDKAIIRRIRGRLFFMFQCSELRKHQLVEAHVRVYCVRHDRIAAGNNYPRDEDSADDDDDDGGGGDDGLATGKHGRGEGYLSDGTGSKRPRRRKEEPRFDVETAYFQTHNVRLQHPDDELGAFLLMALPNVVVHRIDEWSPLCAPALWYDEKGRRHMWRGMMPPNLETIGVGEDLDSHEEDEKYQKIRGSSVVKGFPELLQRACDKEADARVLLQTEYGLQRRRASTVLSGPGATSSGSLQQVIDDPGSLRTRTLSDGDLKVPMDPSEPPQSGSESFMASSTGSLPEPNRHYRASSADGGAPHPSVNTSAPSSSRHPYGGAAETPRQRAKRKYQTSEQREIKAFLKDREAELVVLVEGIDVMTSATLQARHSYRWDDIVWHHTFAPCVTRKEREGNPRMSDGCVIDFSKFHDL